jgi:polyvinyl alcohol dehydrogenase (cytochrome)
VRGFVDRERRRRSLTPWSVAVLLAAALACGGDDESPTDDGQGRAGRAEAPDEWVRLGYDLANTRAVDGGDIDPGTVGRLEVAWESENITGVSGTPVVADGTVYAGDWTGHVRAFDAADGTERWAHDLDTSYVGGAVAVDEDHVYAGTFGARIVALDRATGEPAWEASVDDHPQAVVFGSPVVADGLVVAGVASFEVFTAGDTPTFRGSVVALDATTGAEAWRFHVTAGDEREGPGVSVWSSPAIDPERGVVYIGTGQAYAPPAPPRSDALLALDLETGDEVWSRQFTAGDAWTLSNQTGLDADVGAPPNLFEADGAELVGVGDKAGTYHVLDRATGDVVWEADVTEGGLQGGIMASAAVRDGRVFVASNDASRDAVLVALDAATGEEAWRADVGAHVTGPVTWAGGVLFLADDSGRIAAYDAADGRRLWAHPVPAPAAAGVAVVDGTVFAGWGWWLASPPPDPSGGLAAFRLGEDDGTGEPGEGDQGAASGADVYRRSCAGCHGGSGEGASGPSLAGVEERLTREEHIAVVRDGQGSMPPWQGTLSPEEIEAVVDYERQLADGGD